MQLLYVPAYSKYLYTVQACAKSTKSKLAFRHIVIKEAKSKCDDTHSDNNYRSGQSSTTLLPLVMKLVRQVDNAGSLYISLHSITFIDLCIVGCPAHDTTYQNPSSPDYLVRIITVYVQRTHIELQPDQ